MQTINLTLPYILSNQAQKEVTHAEGLNRLDVLVQSVVESAALATPPVTPVEGSVYIVAAGATGDWAGQVGRLAQRLAGVWRFLAPKEGWQVWDKASGQRLRFTGSAWTAVAAAPVLLASHTVATLPAANPAGGLVYVSDESGGPVVAFSDGTDWRRVTDRAVVS